MPPPRQLPVAVDPQALLLYTAQAMPNEVRMARRS
jgi:hypothetical protein